jgi:hypothetical protein
VEAKLRQHNLRGILILLMFVLLAPGAQRSAAAQSGAAPDNPLLKLRGVVSLCEGRDATSGAACGAFVTGFVLGSTATQDAAIVDTVARAVARGDIAPTDAAIDVAAEKARQESRRFCIRSTWTAGYVAAVVVQYGRENRGALDENSAEHMIKIFAKAFPCNP